MPRVGDRAPVDLDERDVAVGIAVVEVGVGEVELGDSRKFEVAVGDAVRGEDVDDRRVVARPSVGTGHIRRRKLEAFGEMHVATLRACTLLIARGLPGQARGSPGGGAQKSMSSTRPVMPSTSMSSGSPGASDTTTMSSSFGGPS